MQPLLPLGRVCLAAAMVLPAWLPADCLLVLTCRLLVALLLAQGGDCLLAATGTAALGTVMEGFPWPALLPDKAAGDGA